MATNHNKQSERPQRVVTQPSGETAVPPGEIVVTDENVDELHERFCKLSKDDPEWGILGDALGRYAHG